MIIPVRLCERAYTTLLMSTILFVAFSCPGVVVVVTLRRNMAERYVVLRMLSSAVARESR